MNKKKILSSLALTVAISSGLIGVLNLDSSVYAGTKYDLSVSEESKDTYAEKFTDDDTTGIKVYFGSSNNFDMNKLTDSMKKILEIDSPEDFEGNLMIVAQLSSSELNNEFKKLMEDMNMEMIGKIQNTYRWKPKGEVNLQPIFDKEENVSNEENNTSTVKPSEVVVENYDYEDENIKVNFTYGGRGVRYIDVIFSEKNTIDIEKFKDIVKKHYSLKSSEDFHGDLRIIVKKEQKEINKNFDKLMKDMGMGKPTLLSGNRYEYSSGKVDLNPLFKNTDDSLNPNEAEFKENETASPDTENQEDKIISNDENQLDEVSKWYKEKFMPYIEKTFDIVEKDDNTIKYKIKGDLSNNIYEFKNYENVLKEQNQEDRNKINEDDIQENFLINSIYAESNFALNNYIIWQNTKSYDFPYFNAVSRNRDFDIKNLKVGNTEKNFKLTQIVSTTPIVKYPYITFALMDNEAISYSKDKNTNKSIGTIDLVMKLNNNPKASGFDRYKVTKNNNSIMNYYFLSTYSNLKEFVDDFYNKEDFNNISTKGNAIFEELLDFDNSVSSIYKPIFFDNKNTNMSPSLHYLYIKDKYNPTHKQKYISPENLFKFTTERLEYLQSKFNEDKDYAIKFLMSKEEVLGNELYDKLLKQVNKAKTSIELSNILTREVYRNLINNATKDIDFEDVNIQNKGNIVYDESVDKFDIININASMHFPRGLNQFIFTETERAELQKKLPEFRDYSSPITDEIVDLYVDNTMKFHKEFTDKDDLTKFIKENLKGYENEDYVGANLLHQITARYWYNINVGNKIKEISLKEEDRKAKKLRDRLNKIENIDSSTKETIYDLITVAKDKEKANEYLANIENRIKKIEEVNAKDILTKEQKATWADILFKETDYNSISSEINDFIKAVEFIKKQGGENEDNKITLLNNTYFKNRKQKKSLDYAIKNDEVLNAPISDVALEENTDEDTSNVSKPRRKVLNDSLTPEGEAPKEDKGIQTETEKPSTTEAEVQTEKEKVETVSTETQTDNKATTDKGIQAEIAKSTTEAEVQTENSKTETVSTETQTDNKGTTEEQPKVTADKGTQTEVRLEKEDVKESKGKTQEAENKKDSRKTEASKENISNAKDEKVLSTKDKAVKTGDDSNVILSIFSTILAFVTGAYIKRKKNNR